MYKRNYGENFKCVCTGNKCVVIDLLYSTYSVYRVGLLIIDWFKFRRDLVRLGVSRLIDITEF